ncbi:hypothetical protein ACZ90_25965 [Streptomyces albus subsp. albus]|nr:hypothetical protein ACZ90_25965 [Streptomyces albus subsp. albus]
MSGAGAPAAVWALLFAGFHGYWALGGTLGLGDGAAADGGISGGFLVYDLMVAGMCLVGAWVAVALTRPYGPGPATSPGYRWEVPPGRRPQPVPRWVLLTAGWTATALLLARGGIGVLDDLLRSTGALAHGLSGLTVQEVYGEPHPSVCTLWSMRAVDAYFVLGGVLFGATLRRALRMPSAGRRISAP